MRTKPRFVRTATLHLRPEVRYPGLAKGDRVRMERAGEVTYWTVIEVDDDGNGTLEPAPDA